MPVSDDRSYESAVFQRRNVVDRAKGEAMPDITARTPLGIEVAIVLRNRRLKHRRTKIRRVAQILGPGIVRKKRQPLRISTSHVDVTCVVPALRRVLEQVDGAHRKA